VLEKLHENKLKKMLRDSAACALLIPSKAPAKRNQTKSSDKMNDSLEELRAIQEAELEYCYEMEISIEDADL
jgi:hypothetical protein